ncbi:hypothetical protein OKW49_002870 [Paraburkholderia youngii]
MRTVEMHTRACMDAFRCRTENHRRHDIGQNGGYFRPFRGHPVKPVRVDRCGYGYGNRLHARNGPCPGRAALSSVAYQSQAVEDVQRQISRRPRDDGVAIHDADRGHAIGARRGNRRHSDIRSHKLEPARRPPGAALHTRLAVVRGAPELFNARLSILPGVGTKHPDLSVGLRELLQSAHLGVPDHFVKVAMGDNSSLLAARRAACFSSLW